MNRYALALFALLFATPLFAAGPVMGHRNCTGTAAAVGTSGNDRVWLSVLNRDSTNEVCFSLSSSATAADATASCIPAGVGFTYDNGPESINGLVAAQTIYCVTGGSTVRIDFNEGKK